MPSSYISREERESIEFQVNALARSDRDRQTAMQAALNGRIFGWDVATSIRAFDIIQGKATLKPLAMMALIRAAGHDVTLEEHPDGRGVTMTGTRADTGRTHTVQFTLDDAERAGLLKGEQWHKYPLAMCQARATSKLARFLFASDIGGIGYVPDELADNTMTIGADGEVVYDAAPEPDYAARADSLHDVDALRALYIEAKNAAAPDAVIEHIVARGEALTGTPTVQELLAEARAAGYHADDLAQASQAAFGPQNADITSLTGQQLTILRDLLRKAARDAA